MKLRVAIDGRALVGNRTGIGVHAAEITSRLGFGTRPLIASHAEIADREGLESCRFVVDRAPNGVVWQQLVLPRVVVREECDVLWGPHATLPMSLSIPAVVSVHDLTSITMPHRHRLRTILSFNTFIRASLEKAAKIAAVSRLAADEVIRGFGIAPSKIEIVPNGVSEFFTPGGPRASAEPFVLYTGTLEPRKGLGELLAAWSALPGKKPQLVLAGDPGWGTSPLLRRHRGAIAAGAIDVLGFVTREKLRELYRSCAVFVYPSHFEGFGLPPLEAMACGAPVVAARGGAIPDTLGDAALLVAAGDTDALRAAIARVLSDTMLARDLTGRGRARVSLFRWDSSAERMAELLRAAAAGPGAH
ncbi:MAG: glycosyltransferase family 4 protein [Thermoanaerobaculia bacterium]|nr:glycosyltransferase family 4 protein [Thermoanaerobaculia bacterium]